MNAKRNTCSCEYNAEGQLVDTYSCIYHKANEPVYDKIRTKCLQYRPIEAVPSVKPTGFVWPRCKCGEIAQEH